MPCPAAGTPECCQCGYSDDGEDEDFYDDEDDDVGIDFDEDDEDFNEEDD